jgi:hypothetical protein
MIHRKFIIVLMASLLLFAPPSARTETNQAGEYEVKAAYLYHFAQFVEWPDTGRAPSALNVCVLGKSPFGNALAAISGKKVKNRRVSVVYIDRIEDMRECDILFVSVSEKARLDQILASISSRPILTISDIKRFIAAGGMIGFVPEADRLRFEINQRAAQRSSLRVSSQLLKLATRVAD